MQFGWAANEPAATSELCSACERSKHPHHVKIRHGTKRFQPLAGESTVADSSDDDELSCLLNRTSLILAQLIQF